MFQQIKHLFLYGIVGGIATLAEWALFYVLNTPLGVGYMLSTAVAYIVSTIVNWYVGRLILFKASGNTAKEIRQIYIVGIVGLVLNMFIMYALVDVLSIDEFMAKVTATVIVFFWNYLIRKLVIYKEQ